MSAVPKSTAVPKSVICWIVAGVALGTGTLVAKEVWKDEPKKMRAYKNFAISVVLIAGVLSVVRGFRRSPAEETLILVGP